MSALTCMQDANMTPAQDAKVEDNGTSYVIVPEVEGTTLDKEKTLAAVKEAVDQRQDRTFPGKCRLLCAAGSPSG